MNGAYLADKDIAKLAHLWKQKAANGYWLNIYIWANQESMRAAGIFENSGHMACFIGVPYTVNIATGRRKKPSTLFGELHFVEGMYGAGVFAHELQHFMLAWMDEFGAQDHEKLCLMAGNITNEFWNKHYSYYPFEP